MFFKVQQERKERKKKDKLVQKFPYTVRESLWQSSKDDF